MENQTNAHRQLEMAFAPSDNDLRNQVRNTILYGNGSMTSLRRATDYSKSAIRKMSVPSRDCW